MTAFDDIPSLRAFASVAEHKSFSKAADALHITQPAISKRIALLEGNLSEKLFDRLGRKIILTDTGQALLPTCLGILESIKDAERQVNNLAGKVEGTLHLGTSHHIGLHHLPPVISAFGQRYNNVELELHFMSSEQVCEKVIQAELDLGIITLPLSSPNMLISQAIWLDDMQVVVGNHHKLADKKNNQLATLAKYNALLPDNSTYTYKIIEKTFIDNDLTLTTKLSTNYLETIKMMVSVGLGWSVLPSTMIDDDLTVLAIPHFLPSRKLGYVHHKQRTPSNAAQAMMRLLGEQAQVL